MGTNPYISDTDGDGVGDLQDEDPIFLENPIKNNADQEGFQIVEALVENNEDPITKKVTDDHLELTLKNTSGKDLSDFEFYYTITDLTTNQKEAYYEKLFNFVLKSGDTKTIHFDNKNEPDHFTENINSMYRVNDDAKVFDITISTPNYKVVTVKINKDTGGTEKAD
ncbi:MAG: hypothetical protein NTX88_06115 [Candidatus Atribacteria bacterium]|nr:hypothetical protein [Candidatus Atribacteria bacterium]